MVDNAAELRAAVADDLPAVRAVIDAAYAPFRARFSDLPDVSAGLEDDLRDNVMIVAAQGAQVRGVMILVPGPEHLKIANLAVAPEAQGQRLGQRLMAHAEEVAAEHGFSGLVLRTHAGLAATIAFYERLGWRESERSGNTVAMVKDFA